MPDRTRQIERLLETFGAIKRKLASEHSAVNDKAFCNITHSQWGVLRMLMQKSPVTVKDIAAQLSITSSAATQLVDGLVENGHVRRVANPKDRRSLHIEFSPVSKKRMQTMRAAHLKRLSQMFSALSDKQLEQYLALNEKVAGCAAPGRE